MKKLPNSLDSINFSLGGLMAAPVAIKNMVTAGDEYGRVGTKDIFGSAASGAAIGGSIGGPLGAGIGAGAGALITGAKALFGNKKANRKAREAERKRLEQERSLETANTLSDLGIVEPPSSNLPMALGGDMYNVENTFNPIGSFDEFKNGNTHEENPYGGIPQGINDKNQVRLVEEGETKIKFKEGDYIFSNRLTY